MENITKMSEFASTEIKDVQTVKILICYLLYRIGKPVEVDHLYDIAVSTEIINYFFYQDAIDYLIKSSSILVQENDNKKKVYILTEKGNSCAKTLKNYVPKSYRDKLVQAALKYFARLKYESEVLIEYIKVENGYYIRCRCLDIKNDLLDLKLFAPDKRQAELIGNRIMLNPAGFYSKIIDFALNNEEEYFDVDGNN